MEQSIELLEARAKAKEILHALKRVVRRFSTGKPLPIFLVTMEPTDAKQGRIVVYSAFCGSPSGRKVLEAAIDKARQHLEAKEDNDAAPTPDEG